tara:strand:+ start:1351 stop:1488 length:138 start_codon:yes stop_codon:yes gene_type:complete
MDASSGSSAAVPRARFERSRAAPVDRQPVKILDPGIIRPTTKTDQ